MGYYVDFKTGTVKDSGTDATVTLVIQDEQNKPHRFEISDTNGNCFESGSYTSFSLQPANDLGNINTINVSHDNTGTNPGWYLEFVIIRKDGEYWSFPYSGWISQNTSLSISLEKFPLPLASNTIIKEIPKPKEEGLL